MQSKVHQNSYVPNVSEHLSTNSGAAVQKQTKKPQILIQHQGLIPEQQCIVSSESG